MNKTDTINTDNLSTSDLNKYHSELKDISSEIDKTNNFKILTFYKFTEQEIPEEKLWPIRDLIFNKLKEYNIKGTILIATEGINGTISCPINSTDSKNSIYNTQESLDQAFKFITDLPEIGDITPKYSFCEFNPYKKLKIKVRPEIVTFGVGKVDSAHKTGVHVDAQTWNQLLEDPDTIVIDTRNDFECKMGTFKNAINPNTKTFKDLIKYVAENLDKNKHKKIAMCCTGGVRCEKSTAYLLEQGFENVYQLGGGILKYFEDTTEETSLWEGRCFIFDDRIAVNQNLEAVGIPDDYITYGRRDLSPCPANK